MYRLFAKIISLYLKKVWKSESPEVGKDRKSEKPEGSYQGVLLFKKIILYAVHVADLITFSLIYDLTALPILVLANYTSSVTRSVVFEYQRWVVVY